MKERLMLANYRDVLIGLPPIMTMKKEQLLIDELHVKDIAPLKLYYAPHNDVAYHGAKLLIAGLTPGFQQMQLALAAAQEALWQGEDDREACYRAKRTARFAGTMRSNLIMMLNLVGVQQWLELDNCASLFEEHAHWLHSTSIVPYPAFYKGRNYSGSQPDLLKHELLRSYVLEHMEQQMSMFPDIPIIPLGRSVEAMIGLLVQQGVIKEAQVLWGFPHPSGANGHRHQQFTDMHGQMMKQVQHW
jgi:hypothetical protein